MVAPLVVVICLVCAPFFLLPTLIAFKNGKRSRGLVLAGNLALFGGAAFAAPGVALSLVAWLVLLHFALRKEPPDDSVLDEAVQLVPPDPAWPEVFAAERARITRTFDLPVDSIEHIGSTAVPGLTAKPVIDLMLGVPSLPPARDLCRGSKSSATRISVKRVCPARLSTSARRARLQPAHRRTRRHALERQPRLARSPASRRGCARAICRRQTGGTGGRRITPARLLRRKHSAVAELSCRRLEKPEKPEISL
jgi:GrpB-like predicted nucleotidyltransferase (UPF0157 family)